MWIVLAFLAPALFGLSSSFDSYFTNRRITNIPALTFYSVVFNIVIIPIVWLIQAPQFPPAKFIPIFALLGALDLLYLIPYYKALKSEDTSVVSSLFSLGRIIVPILAFFLVGEVLTIRQYIGFFIIVFSSILVTLKKDQSRITVNRSFGLMLLAGIFVYSEVAIYKYIFTGVSWSTGLIGAQFFSFLGALFMLLSGSIRRAVADNFSAFTKMIKPFLAEEFITFGAMMALTYAAYLAPVTFVSGIGAIQSFLVMLYAVFFRKFFPRFFKEKVERRDILRKSLLFAVMATGIILLGPVD